MNEDFQNAKVLECPRPCLLRQCTDIQQQCNPIEDVNSQQMVGSIHSTAVLGLSFQDFTWQCLFTGKHSDILDLSFSERLQRDAAAVASFLNKLLTYCNDPCCKNFGLHFVSFLY